jgi:hypothetical protein
MVRRRPTGPRGQIVADLGAKQSPLVKAGHPDKDDVQVASEDSVTFDSLARTMDMALASGFPDLSLLDNESAPVDLGQSILCLA